MPRTLLLVSSPFQVTHANMSIITTPTTTITTTITGRSSSRLLYYKHCFRVHCFSSDSKPRRGFGRQPSPPPPANKAKKGTTSREEQDDLVLEKRKSSTRQPGTINRAPGLSFRNDGKSSNNIAMNLQFEERVESVKRSALEQKKIDENKEYGVIDYDAPVESDPSTIGLGTKIGIGVAIVVFGLVFALGDFLPTGSDSSTEEATIVNSKLSEEEKENLQTRLQQYEATLTASPEDPAALEVELLLGKAYSDWGHVSDAVSIYD